MSEYTCLLHKFELVSLWKKAATTLVRLLNRFSPEILSLLHNVLGTPKSYIFDFLFDFSSTFFKYLLGDFFNLFVFSTRHFALNEDISFFVNLSIS